MHCVHTFYRSLQLQEVVYDGGTELTRSISSFEGTVIFIAAQPTPITPPVKTRYLIRLAAIFF